jgi:amino-acid N-acetyltransferase
MAALSPSPCPGAEPREDVSVCRAQIRPANVEDAPAIYALLATFSTEGKLLPRPVADIQARIANFLVAELDGAVAACGALRDFGNNLNEIRSLAVRRDLAGQGIGTRLVRALLAKAMVRTGGGQGHVFALTYRVEFFRRLGFRIVDKYTFPPKIWSDCCVCPKKDHCDETAVVIDLPVPAELLKGE